MSEVHELETAKKLSFEEIFERSSEDTQNIAIANTDLAREIYQQMRTMLDIARAKLPENMQRITFECMLSQRWVDWCYTPAMPRNYYVRF